MPNTLVLYAVAALLAVLTAAGGVYWVWNSGHTAGYNKANNEHEARRAEELILATKKTEAAAKTLVKIKTVYIDRIKELPVVKEQILNDIRQAAPLTDDPACNLSNERVCRINQAAGIACADTRNIVVPVPTDGSLRGQDPK